MAIIVATGYLAEVRLLRNFNSEPANTLILGLTPTWNSDAGMSLTTFDNVSDLYLEDLNRLNYCVIGADDISDSQLENVRSQVEDAERDVIAFKFMGWRTASE